MRNPVIVGIDPREPDTSPVVLGAALARLTGAPLVVVASYVHDTVTNAVSGGRVDKDLHAMCASALEAVTAGRQAETHVVPASSAARALHALAVERDAAMLVVGSSRKGRLGRLAPGSTAERLLHGATCPVAVTPAGLSGEWTPRRVGVGFVPTEEGRRALAAAAALARSAGASLEAVTAVAARLGNASAAVPPYEGDLAGARAHAATGLGRALADAGRDAAEGNVFTGEPVDALTSLSERVDVVVCGSRGYGPIQAVLLGGVSHALLREARCPVIVVPRGEAGGTAPPPARREATIA